MTDKYLNIYLNDHLAILVGTSELIERTLENNRGSELGKFLSALSDDAEQERRAIRALMSAEGVVESSIKPAAAWLAERIGRLKLNGQLTGYSELSRLVEMEAIALALESKRLFWDSLSHVGFVEAGGLVTKSLAQRAEQQIKELQRHRREAATNALGFRAPSVVEI